MLYNDSHAYELDDVYEMVSIFKNIILSNIQVLAQRCAEHKNYIWLNTKYNVLDGLDYPLEDEIRGPSTIYSWIQGRGLEALACHIPYLKKYNYQKFLALTGFIRQILKVILTQLSNVRVNNGGHLYFSMDQKGTPFILDEFGSRKVVALTADSPYNFSDLFCAKGMYAAAIAAEDHELAFSARQYCFDVTQSIQNYTFVSDQYQFDKRNPVSQIAGRKSHAPGTIQIGAMTLITLYEKNTDAVETGLKLIEHVLNNYVNLNGRFNKLKEYDFVEFLDNNNQPWSHNRQILSDPGHAVEFVGLAFKFTYLIKRLEIASIEQKKRMEQIESVLPKIFEQNFQNGFQPSVGGICKLFDLVTRTPVNQDMPWWSLPEAIRAALYCWQNEPSAFVKNRYFEIAKKCCRRYIQNYTIPERGMMPIQNRSGDGKIATAIPAVPDNDPCYHTGLSLIDSVEILSKLIIIQD